MRRRRAILVTAAAALGCAHAGETPGPQVDLALAARGVTRGERIDLPPIAVTANDGAALRELEVPVVLGGARRALRIEPRSIRAPNARLEVVDAAGVRSAAPLPPSMLWSGSVADAGDSAVVASIDRGALLAIVRIGERVWTIEPLGDIVDVAAPRRHLVASDDDLAATALQCATTDAETAVAAPATPPQSRPAAMACPRELRIAVELDGAWRHRCGDRRGDPDDPDHVGRFDMAVARAELLLAWAADELARRANVSLREVAIVLDGSGGRAAPHMESDPPATAGAAYGDLWSRWSTRGDAASRDAVVLLSGRGLADHAFGLAWTGGVAGGPAQACAVAGLGATPALGAQAAIVTHVIAHLVGAAHAAATDEQVKSPMSIDLLAPRWPRAPRPTIGAVAAAQIGALVHGRGALRPPALAAPGDVSATDGAFCGGVEVRWTPGATDANVRYQVLRGATDDPGAAAPIGEAAGPPFVDAAAPRTPPARYWVRALDDCRESPLAGGDTGFAPSPVTDAPQAAATDGVGCAEVVVTWTAVAHAASYQVLRSGVNNVGSATPIGTTKDTRFVDTAPPPGGVLWYWVRGVDRCGAHGPTGRGDGGSTGGAPPAPTGVLATDGAACGSIVVTWNAVAGATAYSIWRSATPNIADGSQLATAQASPFEDVAPPADIDLHYWVRAINACGAGPLGGPDRGRAVTNVPRIADMADAVVPCGQPYQSPQPTLVNAECAVPVEWRLVAGPPGLLMAADGSVSWPAPTAGTHTLAIAARNARGAGQEQWMVQVTPHAPQPSVAALPRYAGHCGDALTLAAPTIVNSACAGTIRWSLEASPAGATVGADGVVRWAAPTIGSHSGTLMATNAAGSASIAWQATIAPATPRVAELAEMSARAGTPWAGPTAALENASCAGPVAWTLAKSADGAIISPTGAITWPAPAAGRHELTVRAENEAGIGERTFVVVVAALAVPAIGPIADAAPACGRPWRGEPPALTNADAAGTVRWALAKGPEGATIDERGAVAWPNPTPGEHTVTVTATNAAGVGERTCTLRVAAAAPIVEPVAAAQAPTGAPYTGPAPRIVNAACAGTVVWRLVAAPAGATMDADGVVRWDQPAVGVHTITLTAAGAAGTVELSWVVTIAAPPA